jgi:hypothetical protein
VKHLENQDRVTIAPPYDPTQIDPEFLPYLERINAKPFAASMQCCVGHCNYEHPGMAPPNGTGHWGYIELLMTCPSAVWLCQEVRDRKWLIEGLSKMWGNKSGEAPSYTKRGNFIIALAWDASHWPAPADEICELMDRYHAAEPEEPPHLLKPKLPRERRRRRR